MLQCTARIHHGPGHQSKTHCSIQVPHEQHYVDIGGTDYYWHGEDVFTGFFNESPEEEDESSSYRLPTFTWLVNISKQLDQKAHNYGQIDWRLSALGAFTEFAEAIQELPWRPWRVSDNREPTLEEKAKATDEFADAICTIVRVATQVGITGPELQDAMIRHVERKLARLADGTDH